MELEFMPDQSVNVSGGLVSLESLLPATKSALTKFSEQCGYDAWLGDRIWMEAHWFAWLIAILKVQQDTVELFPHGKWATIQRLEDVLREAAAYEIEHRYSP